MAKTYDPLSEEIVKMIVEIKKSLPKSRETLRSVFNLVFVLKGMEEKVIAISSLMHKKNVYDTKILANELKEEFEKFNDEHPKIFSTYFNKKMRELIIRVEINSSLL